MSRPRSDGPELDERVAGALRLSHHERLWLRAEVDRRTREVVGIDGAPRRHCVSCGRWYADGFTIRLQDLQGAAAGAAEARGLGEQPTGGDGMSRPRSDRLELDERIAAVLADEPHASANRVYRRVGGRRRDALRAVRAIRAASLLTEPPARRLGRFPNGQSNVPGGTLGASCAE